ncbi:MAG: nitroreductase family protein [Thermodesulfobacteriota bacterium]
MIKTAQAVLKYHEETKHLPFRYAPSPGAMDWATEPSPYRRYSGAGEIGLPLLKRDPPGGYEELFTRSSEPGPFSMENIAAFLELSLGLSAQKSFMDSSWALRMNPSSGNLHPTESYIITLEEAAHRGVFHYTPEAHALEKRASLLEPLADMIKKSFRTEGLMACLTSIDWREAWKYGARAFRYSCLDTGHAAAAMSFSAALLGWKITHLSALSDEAVRRMLGFNNIKWTEYEEERIEAAFFVHRAGEPPEDTELSGKIIKTFGEVEFKGAPNCLSPDHVQWPQIESVARAAEKVSTEPETGPSPPPREFLHNKPINMTGASVIRGRRSAQAFNRDVRVSKEDFFTIIDSTVPRPSHSPFDMLHGGPRINILLFVHRVTGLSKGLYMLIRNNNDRQELERKMKKTFLWQETELKDLYLLMEGDLSDEARYLFCQQDIGGDSVFAAAMIAGFRENIEKRPSSYRGLFMEAGMAGQVLYIAAEAVGLRGTGIGCFYDDMTHELMGFSAEDDTFQSLYHFTVGAPLLDSRITTADPYAHIR